MQAKLTATHPRALLHLRNLVLLSTGFLHAGTHSDQFGNGNDNIRVRVGRSCVDARHIHTNQRKHRSDKMYSHMSFSYTKSTSSSGMSMDNFLWSVSRANVLRQRADRPGRQRAWAVTSVPIAQGGNGYVACTAEASELNQNIRRDSGSPPCGQRSRKSDEQGLACGSWARMVRRRDRSLPCNSARTRDCCVGWVFSPFRHCAAAKCCMGDLLVVDVNKHAARVS